MSEAKEKSHTIEFRNNNNNLSEKEDDKVTRKYCCWSPYCFTIWNVKQSITEGGNEKMIELNVVVESLRLATSTSFLVLILLGILATKLAGKSRAFTFPFLDNLAYLIGLCKMLKKEKRKNRRLG